MEPTIYNKPSIYKGAGIYKTGAEGGGGDGIYSVVIDNRVYPVTRVKTDNYDKYWISSNLFCTTGMTLDTHYKVNSSYHKFVYYHKNSLSLIRALLPEGWDLPTLDDYQKLLGAYGNGRGTYLNEIEGGLNSRGLDFFYSGFYSTHYSGPDWKYVGVNAMYPTADNFNKIFHLDNIIADIQTFGEPGFYPYRACKNA